MDAKGFELLEALVACPSATGSEQAIQRLVAEHARGFADVLEPDLHGNLGVVLNPGAERRVVLAAHCDQIGFMVMEIGEAGFLHVDPLGGVDEQTVLGTRVVVHGRKGPVPGVFGKTSTHLQASNEREKTPLVDQVWVDIGARSREEAEERVGIGDAVTYEARLLRLQNDRVAGPGLDNAAGLWAILEVARRCAGKKLEVALHCVSTVQEEVGSRGAESAVSRIRPVVAVSVDTTLTVDDPGVPKKRTAPKVRLEGGPSISMGPNTHPVVAHLLCRAAREKGVSCQREPNADVESNDAKPLQVGGGGVAVASVGIPIRNMHTPTEVMSLTDLEGAATLLTEFVLSLRDGTDLLPISFDPPGRG